jgi:hypothetical protein
VIWEQLTEGTEVDMIVSALTENFEVSYEEANADVLEFLDQLRQVQLLDEES